MLLTNKLTFQVQPNLPSPNTIMFSNKYGGWDTLQVTKYKQIDVDSKSATFRNSTGEYTFSVDSTRKETYFSVYHDNNDYEWLIDLAEANDVYINDVYYNVLDRKFEYDNYESMWTFKITVLAKDRNKITR